MKTRSSTRNNYSKSKTINKSRINKRKVKKNTKITKKIVKKQELDETVKNFCKVYAKIVDKICSEYPYHTDSSDNMASRGYTKIYEYDNGYKLIYKPEEDFCGYVDYGDLELIVPDHIHITEEQEKQIETEIRNINGLLIKDFNTILKKLENRWFQILIPVYEGEDNSNKNMIPTEKEILQIYSNFPFRRVDSNKWSVRFELSSSEDQYWLPISVIKYSNDLKLKQVKNEYSDFSGKLDDRYKDTDKDEYYEYLPEYDEIPEEYVDENVYEYIFENDEGVRCSYAVLSKK